MVLRRRTSKLALALGSLLVASVGIAPTSSAVAAPDAAKVSQVAGSYVALAPTRLLDTRTGNGATGPVPTNGTITVQVGGRGGIPTTGVSAVILNITVTAPTAGGFITAYAANAAKPNASNLNFTRGQTIPNLAVVPVSTDGKIKLTNTSTGTVQLLADIAGYYLAGTPTTAGTFTSLAPTRLLDTRTGNGATGPVPTNGTITVQVGGRGGIPTTGVSAVILNITVTAPTAGGFITAYAANAAKPNASNLNFTRGQTIPNLAVVPVSTDGKIKLTNTSTGTVQLLADIAGYYSSGLTPGTVASWGYGRYGQLGNGSAVDSSRPVPVSGLTGVKALAGGEGVGYALKDDGTVWAWGDGSQGQLGNGTSSGYSAVPVKVSGLSNIVSIGAGVYNGYAVRSDGTAWAWGVNSVGQLGNGTTTTSPSYIPVRVSGLTNVVSIAGGRYNGYAAKSDGTAWSWGSASSGALGAGFQRNVDAPIRVSGLTRVQEVAGGYFAGFARKSDGTVWSWGSGSHGQLGNAATSNSDVPVRVVNLTNVTSIKGFYFSAYALRSDGTVYAWGQNNDGQIGNGTTNDSALAVPVSGLTSVTSIGAGESNGYAVRSDHTVWAWGYGKNGALGNGGTTNSSVPVSVAGLTGAVAVGGGNAAGWAVVGP